MISIGDKYILHSENGHDFDIEVVNINDFRTPDMKYACDVYDDNGTYAGDVMFFGEEFFEKCEKVSKEHSWFGREEYRNGKQYVSTCKNATY